MMSGSGRHFFTSSEKICLQELIIKYKLNSTNTIAAGNPAVKKMAWTKLVEEFNSIETNSKRTEGQLKKCWDNLKSRKKQVLCNEKKNRMTTGGGPYREQSNGDNDEFIEEALLDQTDTEMRFVLDSDTVPQDFTSGPNTECYYVENTEDVFEEVPSTSNQSVQQQPDARVVLRAVTPSLSNEQPNVRAVPNRAVTPSPSNEQPNVRAVPNRAVTPSPSNEQPNVRAVPNRAVTPSPSNEQPNVRAVPNRAVTPSPSNVQPNVRAPPNRAVTPSPSNEQPNVRAVPNRENKAIRATVIKNEFELRKKKYEKASEQEEELHELQKREMNIKIEKELLLLEKAKIDLQSAHGNLEIMKIKKSRLLGNKEN